MNNIEEATESGTSVIDKKFEYYLIRYINVHFKEFKNSYDVGKWLLKEVFSRLKYTKVYNEKQVITGAYWSIKENGLGNFVKRMMSNEEETK